MIRAEVNLRYFLKSMLHVEDFQENLNTANIS